MVFFSQDLGDKIIKLAEPVSVRSPIAPLTGLPGLESSGGERNHIKKFHGHALPNPLRSHLVF
jgi:hypothetical protein